MVAVEDATWYLIPKEFILELLKKRRAFIEYVLCSFLKKLAELTYRQIHDRTLLFGGCDKLLFRNREAAHLMSAHKISSLVLLDADSCPACIITDSDLRGKVVARGRYPADSAQHIMR